MFWEERPHDLLSCLCWSLITVSNCSRSLLQRGQIPVTLSGSVQAESAEVRCHYRRIGRCLKHPHDSMGNLHAGVHRQAAAKNTLSPTSGPSPTLNKKDGQRSKQGMPHDHFEFSHKIISRRVFEFKRVNLEANRSCGPGPVGEMSLIRIYEQE